MSLQYNYLKTNNINNGEVIFRAFLRNALNKGENVRQLGKMEWFITVSAQLLTPMNKCERYNNAKY